MKFLYPLFLIFSLLICFSSCQQDEQSVDPEQPVTGRPTETGKPIGKATSKVIGAGGGNISTPDGKLSLDFPAGALSKETTITIQPVENTALNGVGMGYEFGPDGTEFNKPVKFTYHYSENEVSGASIDLMGLAYQDKNKIWMLAEPITVNKQQKTFTGSLRHFSWWSLVAKFSLTPEQDTVLLGETRELKLTYLRHSFWPFWVDKQVSNINLTAPLDSQTSDRRDVDKIYLNGVDWTTTEPKNQSAGSVGQMTTSDEAIILYTAPAKVPDSAANPVAVAVEVLHEGKAKLMLISNLYIKAENTMRIDGTESNNLTVTAGAYGNNLSFTIYDNNSTLESPVMMTVIMNNHAIGSHPFDLKNTIVTAMHAGKKKNGSSHYTHCYETKSESGSVIIKQFERIGGQLRIKGKIEGTVVLHHETDEHCGVIEHKTMKVFAEFSAIVRD